MLVFVWSSLTDHMFGLSESLQGSVNSRVFFLVGIFAFCVPLIAAPQSLGAKDASLKFVLPCIGAMGTACIAMAPHQSLFATEPLCAIGLIALGIGYCWFVVRYGLFLARGESISRLVYCIAAALIMEPVARLALESMLPQSTLVCVAFCMPIASMMMLRRAHRLARESGIAIERDPDGNLLISRFPSTADAANDVRTAPFDKDGALFPAENGASRQPCDISSNPLLKGRFVLFFAIALLLATVRTLSPVGTWDAEFDPAPMTSSPWLVMAYALCTALFARFTLARVESRPVLSRFQLAFLLIVLTMLASLVLIYVQGPQSAVLYTLMCLNDSFAHLLFWTAVACMARSLPMPAYRIAGLAVGTYAACSVAWLFLVGSSEMIQAIATVTAIVVLYALTIVIVNTNGQHQAANGVRGAQAERVIEAHDRDGESEQTDAPSPQQPAPTAPALADRITAGIEERCCEVSSQYGLSPRETEVLTLLAQGRTRLYIQEELVLAENTVKTHIGHIYRKVGVSNRQELLDLVFEKSAESE